MPARTHPDAAAHDDQNHLHEQADLGKLAAELIPRGYQATLIAAAGRLPCLEVRNPHASVLTERVYAQDDSYWWSWAERITGCDQPATAADALARVLRTTDTD
jgi:hypothetical protein